MKRFSDKRIIKQISNNPLKKGKEGLHPITLEPIEADENMIATQFFITKNKFSIYTKENDKNLVKSRNDIDNMQYPDLSLPLTDYINIYDIDTDEELFSSLKN